MVGIVYYCCNVNGMPLGSIWSENGVQGARKRLGVRPFVATGQFSKELYERITLNQLNRGRLSIIVDPKCCSLRCLPRAGKKGLPRWCLRWCAAIIERRWPGEFVEAELAEPAPEKAPSSFESPQDALLRSSQDMCFGSLTHPLPYGTRDQSVIPPRC